jgi:hypothetical protein
MHSAVASDLARLARSAFRTNRLFQDEIRFRFSHQSSLPYACPLFILTRTLPTSSAVKGSLTRAVQFAELEGTLFKSASSSGEVL